MIDENTEDNSASPLQHMNRHTTATIESASERIWESVVKVFCSKCEPWFSRPWSTIAGTRSTSTGFFIKGRKILCNAHGVTWCSMVRVRKYGSSKKWTAKVTCISHEGDLAILEVEEEKFWEGTTALDFEPNMVRLLSEVVVVGYPKGGDGLSLTKGVVSRIGVMSYPHGYGYLPYVQTDAAINGGNSGGPAIQNDKVVGVAFCSVRQYKGKTQNIGYLIPVPVIQYFLRDIYGSGCFRGFGRINFTFVSCENPSLRESAGLEDDQTGVMIRKVPNLSPAKGLLMADDILLEVNGHIVGNDGTILLDFLKMKNQRVQLNWIISLLSPGEMCKFLIMRDRQRMDLNVLVQKMDHQKSYYPWFDYDKHQTYYVWAGLCFMHYSHPLSSIRVLKSKKNPDPEDNDHHLVCVPTVLDHNVNQSYTRKMFDVEKINGMKVYSVRDAVNIIERAKPDDFIRLEGESLLIIKKSAATEAEPEIKKRYKIDETKSRDLYHPDFKATMRQYYRELDALADELFDLEKDPWAPKEDEKDDSKYQVEDKAKADLDNKEEEKGASETDGAK